MVNFLHFRWCWCQSNASIFAATNCWHAIVRWFLCSIQCEFKNTNYYNGKSNMRSRNGKSWRVPRFVQIRLRWMFDQCVADHMNSSDYRRLWRPYDDGASTIGSICFAWAGFVWTSDVRYTLFSGRLFTYIIALGLDLKQYSTVIPCNFHDYLTFK